MLKSIRDVDVRNQRVLCRVDYNVPIVDGVIMDDTRIIRSFPTIQYLLDHGAFVILASHLGRPKRIEPSLSLKPVAAHLSNLLTQDVKFANQTVGEETTELVKGMRTDTYRIILLENTRFISGETKNDISFAEDLANLADIFVSDAFGTVHRAHSSTVGVTQFLPGYAGLLVEEEFNRINSAMINPDKPAIAIIGGAKVSTKLDVLRKLIDIVDVIAIGGGMAYTFLLAQGNDIGKSLVELEMKETAQKLLEYSKNKGTNILLPVDIRIAKSLDETVIEDGKAKVVDFNKIPKDAMGLDIGPRTAEIFRQAILKSNTIIWNGPVGVFENEAYREGTIAIANTILSHGVDTVIGGGDTAYALTYVENQKIPNSIHISTGGGATLELLGGAVLPGIACLTGKINK
ncbi:MAG: phosphoglycerate kinase [Candidatus Kariarchaeaceae archaeon]